MNWKRTRYLIKSDILRKARCDGRLKTGTLLLTALSPSCIAVIIFRLQHYFITNDLYLPAKLFAILNIVLFSTEIDGRCEIDEGFCLGHANGILIHEQTRIGKNCTIMHQTGLGFQSLHTPEEKDFVILEDDVLIGAGVRLLGPLTIGRGSLVGMNSVVLHSSPPDSLVIGCPAKVVQTFEQDSAFPAETVTRKWKHRPPCTLRETFRRIGQDMRNRAKTDGKSFSRIAYLFVLFNPPALAVINFRFCHWLDGHGLSFIVKFLNGINVVLFKTEIGAKACIDGGLVLLHCNGIIINSQSRIGKNVVFAHHNTVSIGPRQKMDPENDFVIIGDNTFVGAGARIIGNLSIGKNCIVAMNEVVSRSVPDNSICLKGSYRPRTEPTGSSEEPITTSPEETTTSLRETLQLIKADISRRAAIEGKKAGLFYFCKIFLNPPAIAVVLFRFSFLARAKKLKPVAKLLNLINFFLFSVEIQTGASIGPGLVLAHANGIIIHDNSIIGRNCTFMFQNTVTVGPHAAEEDDRVHYANIGDDVIIGMGARIIGPIHIGNNVLVSANAVVTRDVPDSSIVFGIPARKVGRREPA